MTKKKPVFNYDLCMCCNTCIYTCPVGSIEKWDKEYNKLIDSAPRLKDDNSCISCGLCVKACPVDAITLE